MCPLNQLCAPSMLAVLVRSMDRDGSPKVFFSSSSNIVGWQKPKFANFVLKNPTFWRQFTFWIFYVGVGGVTELELFFGSFLNGNVWFQKITAVLSNETTKCLFNIYGEDLKTKCRWNMGNGTSVLRKDSLPTVLNTSSPLCLRSMDRKWGPAECPKQIQTNDLEIQFFEVQYVDNIRCFLVLIWDNKLM